MVDARQWNGKRVFLTGHTGFKGGWLSLWLSRMGAEVHGFALDPLRSPSLCEVAGVAAAQASDVRADLADLPALTTAMTRARPDVLFHLAAQPLVRESYLRPLETFQTNVMGTLHVLEAARGIDSIRAIVVVTTDKVYHNREWEHPYREVDRLGGRDPYSASKAAAELATDAYRASFFSAAGAARVSTARAGNVIGGGDWSDDRLVPGCLEAFEAGETVKLRNPDAVRPWQHVLDPLHGYLLLAERMMEGAGGFVESWNFGPEDGNGARVGEVAAMIAEIWGEGASVLADPGRDEPHEAGLLKLDSSKARSRLGWRPRWGLRKSLEKTVEWHRAFLAGEDMSAVTLRQIEDFTGELS
ncbi:CDP-glucose 4,6-dehydratase [Verrucomicrobiaceae bacterium E54]|nr:CDP-glucose 4,6-dehydratase [Verrucomicrobiaceae bacterium E54]